MIYNRQCMTELTIGDETVLKTAVICTTVTEMRTYIYNGIDQWRS
jgi:hypothetical protein